MNRNEAISIVLAEAFAENGLAVLARQGDDAGFQRMETLISAVKFLAEDLVGEVTLDRALVAALFSLGSQVPEDLQGAFSPTADSRCSLYRQCLDLQMAVTELMECWDNWPSEESMLTYRLTDPTAADLVTDVASEEFEGYRVGDLTYCVVYQTGDFFPVRVIRLGFNVIEVEAISEDLCRHVCKEFLDDRLNRCFQAPILPAFARFGGFDEFTVNSARKSGPKLWLLPYHYSTKTGHAIRQRHADDPDHWPLPTGTVFERWFKDSK